MQRWRSQERAMPETGEAALGEFAVAIAALEPLLKWLGPALEKRVGGHAQHILDSEELAELVEKR